MLNEKNLKLWLYFAVLILVIFVLSFDLLGFQANKHRLIKSQNNYYDPSVFELPNELLPKSDKLIIAPDRHHLPQNINSSDFKTSTIKLPILMYHYVEPLSGKENRLRIGLTTTNKIFDQQLKTLKDYQYQTYFVKELVALLAGEKTLRQKSVILTFDDGYADFYTYVFPLLKKYQLKATVYVIYDAINAPGYLSETQINELLASGLVEIGSHTLDHINLKTAKPAETKRQIFLSKELFEKRFKTDIASFAYPFGAFTEEAVNLTKQAGYKLAVSVIPGVEQSSNNNFYLFRLRPGDRTGKSLLKFIQK